MSNSIDTKIVSKLAEILNRNGLSELEYETENCRVSLSKTCCSQPVSIQPAAQIVETPVVSAPAPVATPATEDDISSLAGCVKSPMVGVVYLSSDPGSPNYVKIGDMVSQGDTVCLIEAMKTFNPVKAHTGGRVTKILVESGDPVEYGEPLVVIE
ncbi:MAG: acetyl-CoA carboxylase biotin carboxyl carrier protein [Alphaproteobacteria bacterium]|nr:acetyl-CoA carboxylase biotin carboxyl carrier protein [Alphaproteobacteria bacterium]